LACILTSRYQKQERRDSARKQIAEGVDPCEQKRAKKSVPDITHTFETIARQWHSSNKKWSESHSEKTLKALKPMYFPYRFTGYHHAENTRPLVPVKAAEAKEIYEIAARLQQRITAIMRYAAQSGIISYNPATIWLVR
jgi:hypothetical protein